METLDDGIGMDPLKAKFKWMFISKLAFVLLNIIYILFLVRMAGYAKGIDQGNVEAAYAFQASFGIFMLLSFLVLGTWILAIVMTCLWVYRAGNNLHTLEMPGLDYTPGWYVGWFFIPLAWWVMPFFTLREIGKASASLRDKQNWKNAPVPSMLIVWYVLFLANFGYSVLNYITREEPEQLGDPIMAFAKQIPDLIIPSIIGLGVYIAVNLPSLLFALKVTRQQHEYMEN